MWMESYFIHSFLSGIFHLAIYVCVWCVYLCTYIHIHIYMYFKIHACFTCSVQFTVFIVFHYTMLPISYNWLYDSITVDEPFWLQSSVWPDAVVTYAGGVDSLPQVCFRCWNHDDVHMCQLNMNLLLTSAACWGEQGISLKMAWERREEQLARFYIG